MRPIYCYFFILSFTVVSCVSTGTYKALQVEKSKSDSLYGWAMQTLKASQADNDRLSRDKAVLRDSVKDLNVQTDAVKENNAALHKQLADMTAISSAQAQSIQKSIDNIGVKDQYLFQLRTALARRDSMNLAVLLELKAALGSFSDTLVTIKVAQGVVGLTVADGFLFGGDSANVRVTDKGKTLLVRLARVLRDQPDIGCRVELYADSVAMPAPDSVGVGLLRDSVGAGLSLDSVGARLLRDSAIAGQSLRPLVVGWDVKARRAASVVSALQNQYNVVAARLTAVARGELGRGTRIVLFPPADQLAQALEKK
jgi:chemotaxis protein MotB